MKYNSPYKIGHIGKTQYVTAANIIFKLTMGNSYFNGQIPIGDSKISFHLPFQVTVLDSESGKSESWNGLREKEWCQVDFSVSSNEEQKKGCQGLDTGASLPLVSIRP